MKSIKVKLPATSILNGTDFDYVDSYQGSYPDEENKISSADLGKTFMTSAPSWTAKLFDLRNKLVAVFGLKTSGKTTDREQLLHDFKCEPNERIGLFKVYHKTAHEVILGEDDKHLNFRVSLLKDKEAAPNGTKKLTISTTVKFNNWLGKLYFLPVKPFHKLIVPKMLSGMIKQLNGTA